MGACICICINIAFLYNYTIYTICVDYAQISHLVAFQQLAYPMAVTPSQWQLATEMGAGERQW